MKQLVFKEEENKLTGPGQVAILVHNKKEIKFMIQYNIFTRDSFEVSLSCNGEVKKLGHYVVGLEQAKKLCQQEWETLSKKC